MLSPPFFLVRILYHISIYQSTLSSYDARGNLRQVLENGKLKNAYEFSPLNRLTKSINAAGHTSQYEYNGLGQRVSKQIIGDPPPSGELTLAQAMGINKPASLNPTNNISYVLDLTKQYHNLLQVTDDYGTKNYAWDFNVVSESSHEGSCFYQQDELGSPLRFSDADGALVESYAYDEFGNDLIGNRGKAQPFGFTGYQYDNLAQTYFAQAREYDPRAGRFVAEDTHWHPGNMIYGDYSSPIPDIDAIRQAGNLYACCINNPLTYVDNTGNNAAAEVLKWGSSTALVVSQLDSPLPGPADLVALGILGLTVLAAGGAYLYDRWTDGSSALKPQAAEPAKIIPFPSPPPAPKNNIDPFYVPVPNPKPKDKDEKDVILYRWGADTPNNFTPRLTDNNGLSVFDYPRGKKNQVTTLNTLRAQGWNVVPISPGHYGIIPMNPSAMPGWQASKAQYEINLEKYNIWSNPAVHPLTYKLRIAFKPMEY